MVNKKLIEETIYGFQEFLEEDMYSKFRPEMKVKNAVYVREDIFSDEKEFREYIAVHFKLFRKQLNDALKNNEE